MTGVHKAAQLGYSTEASTYAHGRPGYPSDLKTWLRETLDIKPGSTIIDLGAGTGKFTRLLKSMDIDVTAVEPVEAKRTEFTHNCRTSGY